MKHTLTLGVILGFGWAAVFRITYVAMALPALEDLDSVVIGTTRHILMGIFFGFLFGVIAILLQSLISHIILAGALFLASLLLALRVMPHDPITLSVISIYLLAASYLLSESIVKHPPTSAMKCEQCEDS